MERKKNHLKVMSVIVLVFAGLTFLRVAGESLFSDSGIAMLPDGVSGALQLIVRLILVVCTLVFLLPRIYIGVKGLRLAKNPAPAKAHIVWAWILLVIAVLGLIEPVTSIISQGSLSGYAFALFNGLLSIAIYIAYIHCAKALSKAS